MSVRLRTSNRSLAESFGCARCRRPGQLRTGDACSRPLVRRARTRTGSSSSRKSHVNLRSRRASSARRKASTSPRRIRRFVPVREDGMSPRSSNVVSHGRETPSSSEATSVPIGRLAGADVTSRPYDTSSSKFVTSSARSDPNGYRRSPIDNATTDDSVERIASTIAAAVRGLERWRRSVDVVTESLNHTLRLIATFGSGGPTLAQHKFEVERVRNCGERRDGGVRCGGAEESSDRFGCDTGAPSEFGFRQGELDSSLIEGEHQPVDLTDAAPTVVVRNAELGGFGTPGEVPLGACFRPALHLWERNAEVTA